MERTTPGCGRSAVQLCCGQAARSRVQHRWRMRTAADLPVPEPIRARTNSE